MTGGTKIHSKRLVAMAAILMAAASPQIVQAQASEPVRIGVLDLHAKQLVGLKSGVTVIYKEFTAQGYEAGRAATPAGPDHGQIVASALVDQYRLMDRTRPISLYAANAFGMKEKADGSMGLKFNFVQGAKALEWMSENGVKVVVTAFNSKDEAGSKAFMDKAESLGMTVFAGAPNVAGAGKVFPAADPRAISVVDSGPDMALRKDPTIATWVTFAMEGSYVTGSGASRAREIGSSYASAKAAAHGAYVVSLLPRAGRNQIADIMKRTTSSKSYSTNDPTAIVAEIDERSGPATIAAIEKTLAQQNAGSANGVMAGISKGPAKTDVVIAALTKGTGPGR